MCTSPFLLDFVWIFLDDPRITNIPSNSANFLIESFGSSAYHSNESSTTDELAEEQSIYASSVAAGRLKLGQMLSRLGLPLRGGIFRPSILWDMAPGHTLLDTDTDDPCPPAFLLALKL